MNKNLIRKFYLIFGFVFLLYAPQNISAQTDIYAKITTGQSEPLELAIGDFVPVQSFIITEEPVLASQIKEIVKKDLSFSLFFEILEPPDQEKIAHSNPPDWNSWVEIGAEFLISGEIELKGTNLRVKADLWDLNKQRKVMSETYRTNAGNTRKLAHQISNDLVYNLVNEKGIFNTRITYLVQKDKTKEVFVCDYDGYNPQQITYDKTLALSPKWSADGEKISYTSYKSGNPDLWLIHLESGKTQKLSSYKGINSAASWSPDGKYIALTLTKDGNAEIYLMGKNGDLRQRLTNNFGIDSSPSWSPNSQQIAFTSDRPGSPQIYIMDLDGANLRRLTFQGDYNDSPAWSPKGDKIAFCSREERGFQIYTIDITGENLRRLTNQGTNENPQWSPDGYHLVFTSNRSGKFEIYTMHWDGSNQQAITSGGNNSSPAWSPIGD